ncbi:MAG: MBOAT family protein [bacterium]|nr:MBOAT family protein [bacterium]
MVFSSVPFLFYFLPIVVGLYYLSFRFRNIVLCVSSLVFYVWGEPRYFLLLIGSICANYVFALLIDAARGSNSETRQHRATLAAACGLICNLLLLGVCKYAGLFTRTLDGLLLAVGLPPVGMVDLHLPLGVSFFTFQAMSYLIDVYRQDVTAERRPMTVALYISMFPQLIAGPIVRFKDIVGQLHNRKHSTWAFAEGIRWFVIGLGQKVILADTLSTPADAIFAIPAGDLTFPVAWLGAICFSLQIYFDFAGYSTMVIGLGLLFGFHLPRNFDYPYVAQSITAFWRRWHMTLSQWFRDYLYIPLGGNRRDRRSTCRNLLIVFVLCGLWHGAAWKFILWGLFHGLFLMLERVSPNLPCGAPRPARHLYTLAVVIVGWVLFRAETLSQTLAFLGAMTGMGDGDGLLYHTGLYLRTDVVLALAVGCLASTDLRQTLALARQQERSAAPHSGHALVAWLRALGLCCVLVISILLIATRTSNPFIYFRF